MAAMYRGSVPIAKPGREKDARPRVPGVKAPHTCVSDVPVSLALRPASSPVVSALLCCVLFIAGRADLLILGVGERMSKRLDPALVKHLSSKGIRVEQMDSVSTRGTRIVRSCVGVALGDIWY